MGLSTSRMWGYTFSHSGKFTISQAMKYWYFDVMKSKGSSRSQWPVLKTAVGMIACLFLSLKALTQTPISGVINTYYSVVEYIPSRACLRLNTTSGLTYGTRTMLIQIKGATINTTNSVDYGNLVNLNSAGNYEIGIVCRLNGDSVFFVFDFLSSYDASSALQLVKIPRYASAVVTDTLKAAPWDPVTGTGGVLGLMIDDELILNAPISADSAGYHGGRYYTSGGTCSNFFGATSYYYNPTSSTQNGASKGEGVAIVPTAQAGGRGAPANGGGGGNNHNNGGAGGANLTAGGDGGGNSSSTGCTLALQGLGGKALNSSGGTRIFLGGGGGAGHSNYALSASAGGNGGGIIFIRANRISGTQKISANGDQGGGSISDGAGGAGAGGTIIISTNDFSSTGGVEAKGGTGGLSNNGGNLNYCYGAGGGGSGGVIYFSGDAPASGVTVDGGAGGVEISRHSSCAPIVPSEAGADGLIIEDYQYRESDAINPGYCSVPLPIKIAYFRAELVNGNTELTWRVLTPDVIQNFVVERRTSQEDWKEIADLPNLGTDVWLYHHTDRSPHDGYNFYRLKIVENTGHASHSSIQSVLIGRDADPVRIYPNPAKSKITISGDPNSDLMQLYDINGRKVWEKRLINDGNSQDIDLPNIQTGIYLIMIGDFVTKISIIN